MIVPHFRCHDFILYLSVLYGNDSRHLVISAGLEGDSECWFVKISKSLMLWIMERGKDEIMPLKTDKHRHTAGQNPV